jgi:alkylated DNA repair dioxygenase AlkB
MQRSLFGAGEASTVHWEGCEFRLERDFLDLAEADELMTFLVHLPGWRQDKIRMYGKEVALPRLHRWFAEDMQRYQWSGLEMQAEAFPDRLTLVRARVAETVGTHFNSTHFNTALANYYRDGRDSVAWHADDEPELGSHPVIASFSLGASRRFLIRKKDDPGRKIEFELPHGSLFIMCGKTQRVCEHCLPKQKAAGARVNLTFREIGTAL